MALRAVALLGVLGLAACGAESSGSGDGADMGTGGGEPTGGTTGGSTGGSTGGNPTGGTGGDPVGGSPGGAGGEPVGGSMGGAGGEPVGGNAGGAGGEPVGGNAGGAGGAGGEEPPPAPDACAPDLLIDFNASAVLVEGAWELPISVDGEASGDESAECGGRGPERAARFIAPSAGRWRFTTAEGPDGGFYDTVLSIRGACGDVGTELACNDDGFGLGRGASEIEIELAGEQELYLLVDAFGAAASGTAILRAATEIAVGEGEACDLGGFPRICGEGFVCTESPDGSTCEVATPPSITSAEIFYDVQARSGFAIVEGLDPEDNVGEIRLELLDFTGRSAGLLFLRAEPGVAGAWRLAAGFNVQGSAVPYSGTLIATDSTGLLSEAFDVAAFSRQETLGAGDACQPDDPSAVCGDGLSCLPAEGGFACAVFDGTCDAAVATLSDVMPDEGGAYVWDGDTHDGADNGSPPCHAATTREQLVRFVAPAAGDWRFTVDPTVGAEPMGDSVLAIRAACGATGPAVVCNDDGGGDVNLGSGGIVSLEAGEGVVLHIEGFGRDGTYRLAAAPAAAAPERVVPVLDTARLEFTEAGGVRLSVAGTAGEGPVEEARVDLYADGLLIAIDEPYFLPATDALEAFDVTEDSSLDIHALVPFADTAVVTVTNFDRLESNPVETPVVRFLPELLPLGAECVANDPWAPGICIVNTFCIDGDGDPETPTTCSEFTAECPAEFGATTVDTAAGAPFVIDGDLAMAPAALGARCDRGTGERVSVYVFTAPEAGLWRFETSNLVDGMDRGDSIVSVRSACNVPTPEAVLACDDDAAGDLQSRADVELEAGQTVYVSVYGFATDRLDTYTLTIAPAP
ncbi:hypothetical protein L6V77_27650 [Myxococcota bacterium]|nr:hypothetical protein [Myxococcota bacterium]